MATDFSFFRLSLEKFLLENHSPKVHDIDFITSRCDEAEEIYQNSVKSGMRPVYALEIANKALFDDPYFFKYNILRDVVLEEFPEIKEEEHAYYLEILLTYCEDIFAKYPNKSRETWYSILYTELVGAVAIYLEDHHVI